MAVNNILKLTSLRKQYESTRVLNDISLQMEEGGFLILVGPSGCGKSTLLNCIAGLDQVTDGQIEIAQKDVTRVEPKDRNIAMVFQSYALYPTMTVRDNIAFGMKVRNVPKQVQSEKIDQVAGLLQINHLLDRKPGQLSGGQRQRVAIGRALVRDPALYLFDEPLSNLDAKLRVEMRSELKQLHQQTGSSFVYVTHDQVEAMTMGTKIAVLNAGSIQQFGTPHEIYHRPANVFVASFMGSPPMNILKATVRRKTDGVLHAHIRGENGTDFCVPVPMYNHSNLKDGDPVLFGIRPEHMECRDSDCAIRLPAFQVETTGFDYYVKFKTANGELFTARVPEPFPHVAGDMVCLTFKPSEIRLFDADTELAIQ